MERVELLTPYAFTWCNSPACQTSGMADGGGDGGGGGMRLTDGVGDITIMFNLFIFISGLKYAKARTTNFFKLFRFQQGNNDQNHSFPMVYPTLNRIKMETWTSERGAKKEVPVEDEFVMVFFIPKKLYDNPPKGRSKKDEVSRCIQLSAFTIIHNTHQVPFTFSRVTVYHIKNTRIKEYS